MTVLLSTGEGSQNLAEWTSIHTVTKAMERNKPRDRRPGLTCAKQEIKADSLGEETSVEGWNFPVWKKQAGEPA